MITLFSFGYLTKIFAIHPITSCLEDILMNIIKESFTHKIEEPDSLFNFYEMFLIE